MHAVANIFVLLQAFTALPADAGSVAGADGLRAARELRLSGEPDRAIQELTKLLNTVGENALSGPLKVPVLRELGEIYLDRKQAALAATYLERSLTLDPVQPVVHYELGLAFRNQGRHREAAQQFETASTQGFRNLALSMNLIEAYFASRQSRAAVERARDLIASLPQSADLLLRLGQLLISRLYYEDALNAFHGAQDIAPERLEPRFNTAVAQHLLGKYAEAVRTLSDERFLGHAEAASLNAAATAAKGDPEKGAELLVRTIEAHPQSPHAWLNLALIRMDQGRAEEAERLLERFQALGAKRDATVFYVVQRNSCADLGAETASKQNVRPDANKAAFYFDLASQMQDHHHYAAAVELIRLARRYEGNSGRLLYAAGLNCLNLLPGSPDAVGLLREAVIREPQGDRAWFLLGRACARTGDTECALTAFRTAISLHPSALYLIGLARVLLSARTADYAADSLEAETTLRNAVALEPSNAIAHYELGRLLLQREHFEESRSHLTAAAEMEPDFYEAYYSLSRVYLRTGDRTQAQRYMDLFEQTKRAVAQQAVLASGDPDEGRE